MVTKVFMETLKPPQYTHLSHINFESQEDRDMIYRLGMEQWNNNEVLPETEKLGKQFIQQIESAYMPQVSVRWINDKIEYSLFAEEDLAEGSYVGEYTGIVRRNDRRYFEPLNNYCYTYPVRDEIGRNFVIDATQGNLTRFINHSFTPNLQPVHVFHEGFYHLIFLAIRKIQKGAQLSYNYGQSYWQLRETPERISEVSD